MWKVIEKAVLLEMMKAQLKAAQKERMKVDKKVDKMEMKMAGLKALKMVATMVDH